MNLVGRGTARFGLLGGIVFLVLPVLAIVNVIATSVSDVRASHHLPPPP